MTKKLPISVFIIAKNEGDRIALTIGSVRNWVDEIIVVDSGSGDDTVAISQGLGASTHYHAWHGYGPQKVYAESLCRNDWVFNLDADEVISDMLYAEIEEQFAMGDPACSAFRMPFLPIYYARDRGHPATARHSPVRLYRRSCAGFKNSPVHDSVVVRQGDTIRLRGMVLHKSFRDISDHVQKADFYSALQSEDLYKKQRKPSFSRLLLIPIVTFFKSYFLRREFRNGIEGIIASHMYAFQRFLREAKIYEQYWKHEHPPEQPKL